jgi:DNA-binding transcriptional ArsR family regulator
VRNAAPLFAALADETRLELLMRLTRDGPGSIAALSAGSSVSRQAITKHLKVLADAGYVRSRRQGRERVWRLRREQLDEVRVWLDRLSAEWDEALGRLKSLVEE